MANKTEFKNYTEKELLLLIKQDFNIMKKLPKEFQEKYSELVKPFHSNLLSKDLPDGVLIVTSNRGIIEARLELVITISKDKMDILVETKGEVGDTLQDIVNKTIQKIRNEVIDSLIMNMEKDNDFSLNDVK